MWYTIMGKPTNIEGAIEVYNAQTGIGFTATIDRITDATPDARIWLAGFLNGCRPESAPFNDSSAVLYEQWKHRREVFLRDGHGIPQEYTGDWLMHLSWASADGDVRRQSQVVAAVVATIGKALALPTPVAWSVAEDNRFQPIDFTDPEALWRAVLYLNPGWRPDWAGDVGEPAEFQGGPTLWLFADGRNEVQITLRFASEHDEAKLYFAVLQDM
ncbi:hypothetical protein [Tsukamurella soli]|uniref:hypothetical protein n=1 Tax=Tsukamurella soli TaxID=644556 RepID=UPI0031E79B3E